MIPKEYLYIAISMLTAFLVVLFSVPSIVKVALKKHLFDEPGLRTSHKHAIPTLGGLAIFAGFIFSLSVTPNINPMEEEAIIIAASVIIFFIGLKDDILVTAPITKLGGQLVSGAILVVLGDIRITSLHGFYGITEIPYTFSLLLTIFLIIVIINAFNLIDGIDGLSSGIGILTASTFGIWFYLFGKVQWAVLSFALVGSLMAFFIYNVFGKKNKIFMGDTGSLLLGLIMSIITIQFNEFNKNTGMDYAIHAAPAVAFGILIVPLFDTLRVMFIRIVLKRSPFKADKNHIHHKLLDLGYSHIKSTLILLFVNIIFIIFVFAASDKFEILRLMLLLLIAAMIISHVCVLLADRKRNARNAKLRT